MIYFDSTYVARLYLEDPGWQPVRELATHAPITCNILGRAEVVAAIHRKFREGLFTLDQYRQVLEQFALDCDAGAFVWLPLSDALTARIAAVYESLPKTVFLRAGDAIHLASAADHALMEIYSNDQRLLAAAPHFGLKGINII